MIKRLAFISAAAISIAALHTGAHAEDRAGTTVRVQPEAYQRTGFFPGWLDVGDEIYREAKIYTEAYGSVEILFDDQTKLTVSPRSEIVIDDFVYSPESSSGRAVIRLGVGALRMISGRMKSESYEVRTQVATIGVRGTEFSLDTNTDEITKIWITDGTVIATTVGTNQTFEFDAPAYAECSASACSAQDAAGAPPTSFPAVPEDSGPSEPDAGGDGGDGGD